MKTNRYRRALGAALALCLAATALVTAAQVAPASALGTITLDVTYGPVGTSVIATTTEEFGFLPGATSVSFTNSAGSTVGDPADLTVESVGDSAYRVGSFVIPDIAGGVYTLDFESSGAPAGSARFVITFGADFFTAATLPDASACSPYQQSINASGLTTPYTIIDGSLPEGLSMDSFGDITGTPTGPGTEFVVEAGAYPGESGGINGIAVFNIGVNSLGGCGESYFAEGLDDGVVGAPYSGSVAGVDAGAGTFEITVGALPPGLNWYTDGTIDGSPVLAGTFTFTVTYTDGEYTETAEFTVTIDGVCTATAEPSTVDIGDSSTLSVMLGDSVAGAFVVAATDPFTDLATLLAGGATYDLGADGTVSIVGSVAIDQLTEGAQSAGELGLYVVTFLENDGPTVVGCTTTLTVEDIVDVPTLFVSPFDQALEYGDPVPDADFYTYTVLDEEGAAAELDTPATCTSAYTTTTAVADSPLEITCSGASKAGYDIEYLQASLGVDRAALYAVPDPQTLTYGDDPPTYTFSYQNADGETVTPTSLEKEPTCTSDYTNLSTPAEGTVLRVFCFGDESPLFLLTANYLIITLDQAEITVLKRTLYVVPDPQTRTFGSAAPSYTFDYFSDAEHTTPAVPNAAELVSAPVCSSSYTTATAVSASPLTISCSGGQSGVNDFEYDTAQLTITKATATAATYMGTTSTAAGGTITLAAAITPANCTAVPTYSLDANPITGAPGPYPLTGPTVSTQGWANGVYVVTVSYADDGNCTAVSDSNSSIGIGSLTPGAAFGGGWYNGAGGRSSFGFQVQSFPKTAGAPATVKGQVAWSQKGSWRFKGTLTTYTSSGGVGTATGTGTLQYWRANLNGGSWVNATTTPASVTIRFTATSAPTKKSTGSPGSFTIGFTGTTTGGPTLPVLGTLSTLANGNIKMS